MKSIMNNKTLITLVAQREILTKFKIDNDEFSVFTIFDPYIKSEFKSLIKIASKNRALWAVKSTNTTDAAMNHIALINMVQTNSIFRWNDKVFAEHQHSVRAKSLEMTTAKERGSKTNSFVSNCTRTLFQRYGLNASYDGVNWDSVQKKMGYVISIVLLTLLFVLCY